MAQEPARRLSLVPGSLEAVAEFHGPMPTGVTVAHAW